MDNASSEVSDTGGAASRRCALCDRARGRAEVVRADMIRRPLFNHIASRHPERWPGTGFVCATCLAVERADYVRRRLEEERGDLSAIEAEVARKAAEHETIARHIDEVFSRSISRGQRAADSVARVGGSWTFVLGFGACLILWIVVNTLVLRARPFDPYPYILLNLVLSCLAAVQAPIIMMAQNRQSTRDRAEADQDFRINLKAEIEVASLHEKIDHLLHDQWDRLVEMQEMQIDLLQGLARPPDQR
jgi:uncharacterized membrane protein